MHDEQCPLFEFQPVTEEEVGKIIRSLPSNKTPGQEKVTARVLNIGISIRKKLMLMLMSRLSSLAHKLLMLMSMLMLVSLVRTGL